MKNEERGIGPHGQESKAVQDNSSFFIIIASLF